MPGENIQDWSPTAALNGSSDSAINWAEGQPRASVNNSARSMMAAHAKQRNLLNGSIVAGGTVNGLTFFSGLDYTTVPTGLMVKLKIGPALTNTGPCTLNMDNIGQVQIVTNRGLFLVAGEIQAGSFLDFVWNGTNWILLTELGTQFSTGDVKTTLKIIADIGWLMMNDGSIGNATSGATTRANADTEALFVLLYTNIPALILQDSAGTIVARGASAAADYAANRRLVLPLMLGRSLAGAGAGSGLSPRVLGTYDGAETHTQTIAEMATHDHIMNNATLLSMNGAIGLPDVGGLYYLTQAVNTGPQLRDHPEGGGQAMNIMNPRSYINVMIKL